jgi:tetratricopeptide (TPR) repeat protein
LAELLERELESLGRDAAVASADALRDADRDALYVDEDELIDLAGQFAANDRMMAAGLVLELAAAEFPGSHRPWQVMGERHLQEGDVDEARIAFTKSLERNRRSYPWQKREADLAEAVLAGKKLLISELEGAGSDEGFAAVIRDFRGDPEAYYFTESAVNSLGYELLGAEQVERAIEVFLINTRRFPGSANVWDSLGDSYRAKGDIAEAIASYQKALEVDPSFEVSRRNLEELQQEQRKG